MTSTTAFLKHNILLIFLALLLLPMLCSAGTDPACENAVQNLQETVLKSIKDFCAANDAFGKECLPAIVPQLYSLLPNKTQEVITNTLGQCF